MAPKRLFYWLGGLIIAVNLISLPVQAETLTFEYTAKSWLMPNEDPKEAEMLASLESFHNALNTFASHLENQPLFKQSKVKKEYLNALALTLVPDYITYDPQPIHENNKSGVEVKTKLKIDSFGLPDNLDTYFQEHYLQIAILKMFLPENERLTQRIGAYVQKLAAITDNNYLQALRQSEGMVLHQEYDVGNLLEQANRLRLNNQLEKATQLLTQAIQINPSLPLLYISRVETYASEKKYDLMLKDLNKAIELQPNQDVYYFWRGATYFEQGILWQEAKEDFNKSIELNPNFANAYFLRGYVFKIQRNCFDTVKDFKKACDLGWKKACTEQCNF